MNECTHLFSSCLQWLEYKNQPPGGKLIKTQSKHKNANCEGNPNAKGVMWKLNIAARAGLQFVDWTNAKIKAQYISSC